MRFSIETRLPFLNYKLVEFCAQAPIETKLHDGWTKWMLRRGVDGVVPSAIAWRRDKRGYSAPDREWLQHWLASHGHELSEKVVSAELYVERDFGRLVRQLTASEPALAWRVICVEKWLRLYRVML